MSKPTTHLIYVPGLGDGYDTIRKRGLKLWRKKGLTVEFLPMNWRNERETYTEKMKRLETAIDRSKADRVVLVGESAGGSIVVVAGKQFEDKVAKVITICGKNIRAERVAARLYQRNPAFKASMFAADKTAAQLKPADASRYTTFYSKLDPVIFLVDTKLPHAKLRSLPLAGHLFSILAVLFLYWPIVIREATAR